MLNNNYLALGATFVIALIWLRINDYAAHKGWISSHLSRKIIHAGTGPVFVICWTLFDNTPWARYLAALVPLAITLQFLMVGLGVVKDESAVQAMSRTGDRREILKGPLFYGVIFVIITILYWTTSPIGIIALMLMCGGDAFADILGRKYGKVKLPWNRTKSWIGSLGMLLGGFSFSILIMLFFTAMQTFSGSVAFYIPPLITISIAGTIIESLPVKDIDNLTVTLTAIILGHLLL